MVKNIYSLTPLQEGMLFHSLYREDTTPYFEQMIFDIEGSFDIEIFELSWNKIIQRYDVFRTIFIHKNSPTPKQVVLKQKDINLIFRDISSDKNHQEYIDKFIEDDKKEYFDLSKKPPLRVTIFKIDDNLYRVIFSFHHILMDGWSGGIVFGELFSIYDSLKQGTPISLSPTKPYSLYIKWLNNQDKSQSKKFWDSYLVGYKKEASIPSLKESSKELVGYKLSKNIFEIDESQTSKLNLLVSKNSLTLNTLMQTLWGVLLAKLNLTTDVVFGATVSGRVDEVEDIENMVGLFINAIPIRVKFDKDTSLLELSKHIMQDSIDAKSHHYYSLAEIQNSTLLKDNLIKQLLVFENYPTPKEQSGDMEFEVKNLDVFNQTNYDFDITIMPHSAIEVMFKYNSLMYDEKLIKSIQNGFLRLIDYFIDSPLIIINDIVLDNFPTQTKTPSYNAFISSTFTAEPIEESLSFWSDKFGLDLDISFSGYNQIFQDLLNPNSSLYSSDLNILLIRFEDVLRFKKLTDIDEQKNSIEDNYQKIVSLLDSIVFEMPIFIPIFSPKDSDLSLYLNKLYEKFYNHFSNIANIYLIDVRELRELYQVKSVFDIQQDKIGHIPFSDDYFWAMGAYLSRKIYTLYNPHFKVIALDCDNTLWGGVVGEDGALGVDISGGYLELQKFVLRKETEGFLIVLNSKNNPADVWEVFDKNPNMLLKREHIVNSKINWHPKSQNLKEMAKELNLGLDSFVFLDDNPLECSEVIQNAPEVLSLPLPKEPNSFGLFLNHIWALDKLKITLEDKERTQMYQAETKREETSQKLSMDDFLASLELKIYMNKMFSSQLARASQLTQRTNQFNISTIRRSESDITQLLEDKNYICWTISVEDKFGDYGVVGVVISQKIDEVLSIDTFLMSCRVLGRGVENTILSGLKRYAQDNKISKMQMPFYPTAKNQPALDFIENANFILEEKYEDKIIYALTIDNLPNEASFVEFFFDRDEPILADKIEEEKVIVQNIIEEKSKQKIDDFEFDFLDNLSSIEIDKLSHQKFYEPLKFHRASDSLKLSPKSLDRKIITEFISPTTEDELKLAQIYKELLNIDKIGTRDCFFDLGGHSLIATRLLSRVYQSFKVELLLQDIFNNSTIEKLSKIIQNKDENLSKNISLAPQMDSYPLSNAQKRVWLLDKMGAGVAYSMPIVFELSGDLDIDKFEFAFNQIIARHEILRTKFIVEDDEPRQELQESLIVKLQIINSDEESVREILTKEIYKSFDLKEIPLFRLKLFKIKENRYIFYFNMHHIISDGWSLGVITDEMNSLYNNKELEPLTIQYKDYAIWQNRVLSSNLEMLEAQKYWHSKLKDEIEPLAFPTDNHRPKEQTFNGDSLSIDLSQFIADIGEFNKNQTTTLFMFVASVVKIILARYSNQDDIILGFPISGRERVELENQIGFYANTLVLRDKIDFESDFTTLINQIKQTTLEAFRHQNYPFEKLVSELNITRDISRSPIFDYTISLNSEASFLRLGEVETKPFDLEFKMSQFDMSFNFNSTFESLILDLNYNSDLFKQSSIKRVLENIKELISNLINSPTKHIREITFLNEPQREFRVAKEYNESIIELFEKQAQLSPNTDAIYFDGKNITYQELDRVSNRVANYLKDKKDIKQGDIVAFHLERSEFSVIAILAILKVGATFLPINISLPKERIDYILKDSKSRFLINQKKIIKATNYHQEKRVKIKRDLNSSAYIIYTSGTTGNPKGVEVSDRSLLNLCRWYIDDFDIDTQTKALLMIPTSFDASIKNILAPLFVGGEVIISREQFDAFELIKIIQEQKITLINCVPSAFKPLLELSHNYQELKSITHLAFGGESLDISAFRDYYLDSNIKLFNIYGPTEACDISTIYQVQKEDLYKKIIPIGREISNATIYVLDRFGHIAPTNVIGELVVGGVGVAKGYLNNRDLSEGSFVVHPKLGRVYKSGDLAKVLDDGNIEFIGRSDDQVKIRGNRIELSEIEHKILELGDIKSAFVLVKNSNLVAYIKPLKKIKVSRVKEHLQNSLPSYMIPTEFIKIKDIPLTPNGKIDKNRLLQLKAKEKKTTNKELNPKEKKLLTIFEEVLDKKLSIDDNFFEMGGDSLNGVKLISTINEKLDKNLKLSYIFEYQVIRDFITCLDDKQTRKEYKIYNADKKEVIFIFPALIESNDYTLTPQKLSKYLSNYKIYALDFLLDEDRVEKYIRLIESLESEEHIFLGYSSGGNLAYEVAKRSKNIKKLILLDSWKIKKRDILSKKDAKKEFQRDNIEIDNTILKSYIEMLNSMNNNKKVDCDIDLISFKKEKKIESIWQGWQNSTKREFSEHIGFGDHYSMLKDDYLAKNSKIINQIIKGEKDEK